MQDFQVLVTKDGVNYTAPGVVVVDPDTGEPGAASPTGGATEAKQDTLITNFGAKADAEATTDTGAFSLLALFKRALSHLTAIAASLASISTSSGSTLNPSYNFNRPNDTAPYTIDDLVANNTSNASVVPMEWTVTGVAAGSGHVIRARLMKSSTVTANALFVLHLFKTAPTVTNGDNGAYLSNNVANRLGSLTFSACGAYSDGAGATGVPTVGENINFKLAAGQKIYGLLQAKGAYVPTANETITVELEVVPDN